MIPCLSQELLPSLSVIYFFLPPFPTNYSSILSHPILPSISWSTSQSCCSQIHIQYSFILFSSILCTCPNQRNLFNLTVPIIICFLNLHKFLNWLISSNFLFHYHTLGLKFFYTLSFQKHSIAFYLCLLVARYHADHKIWGFCGTDTHYGNSGLQCHVMCNISANI